MFPRRTPPTVADLFVSRMRGIFLFAVLAAGCGSMNSSTSVNIPTMEVIPANTDDVQPAVLQSLPPWLLD